MTGSEHFRRAEELAAKANEYLGQGDGQDTAAAVWAGVTQVHATLAPAAATALNVPHPQGGMENHDSMAWFKSRVSMEEALKPPDGEA
jgi:hypothetical protein